tara:strand:+ start:29435 stop:29536 length:102 start_codon:yes stop_codon:yes gene_type:complete
MFVDEKIKKVKLLVSVFESKDDGETFEISTVVN